jgi:glycerol-3-phosphate dehydrogenase
VRGFDALTEEIATRFSGLPRALIERLTRAYGTRAYRILDGCKRVDDLGRRFGADLYEREVAYLAEAEWAREPDDILWRRSKLGLRFTREERQALEDWLKAHEPVAAA